MARHWTGYAVLAVAALLVACEQAAGPASKGAGPRGGPQTELVQTTTDLIQQLLLKFEAASDGTLTLDDPLPFGTSIHVVDHDNKDSWKIDIGPTGSVTFENNGCDDASPLPTGALHLFVGQGNSYARLRSTRYHRTYLRDLSRLDYYACDHSNNGQQWPYVILDINWNGGNTIDDLIFFEPAYQSADGGACGLTQSQQQAPVYDVWQFWDALRKDNGTFKACYWALSTDGTGVCSEGIFVCSLSEYITMHPAAAIINVDGNHGGVQVVHGFASFGDVFDGWVDGFTIGKDINSSNGQATNSTITYDFQER